MYFDTIEISSLLGIFYIAIFAMSLKFGFLDAFREYNYDKHNTNIDRRTKLITLTFFSFLIIKPYSLEQRWRVIKHWIGLGISLLILQVTFWMHGG